MLPRLVVWMLSVGVIVLGTGVTSSQNYPNKPIRMVTIEAGGSSDISARLLAPGIAGALGQPVILDNRGGGSLIAGETVAKAPPDGYTVLFVPSSLWLLPYLRDNVPYDPVKDFSPITLVTTSPLLLVVHASLPVKSVKELIALAKARPGELNLGSGSTAGAADLAGELFKAMAGVNIVRVPYKGGGATLNALIGGEVQLIFVTVGTVGPHVKTGRLKALAVTSAQPSALAPNLPTIAASGLLGYEAVQTLGMFAPAKTPATLINRLNQEVVRALNRVDLKERFFNVGSEVVGSSPAQLAAAMKSEMAFMGKVIRDAGIRAE